MNRCGKLVKRLTVAGVVFLPLLATLTQSWVMKHAMVAAHAPGSTMRRSQRTLLQSSQDDKSMKDDGDSSKKESFEVKTRNPLRLAVLRLGLTEPAATSPLNYGKYDGTFSCAYCGQSLFDSNAKYDSKSGWPSFWRSIDSEAISYKAELDGRLECRCKRCTSHLGHVFLDGPRPTEVDENVLQSAPESDPRGRTNTYLPRFCLNGASLRYNERE